MVTRPNKDWSTQPLPPEKLKTPQDREIDLLKAELKTERNEHARTRDELGAARAIVRAAKTEITELQALAFRLQERIQEQLSTIRQLEDIKL